MTLPAFDTGPLVRLQEPWEPYEINEQCAAPKCSYVATDNHHIVPRGAGWPKKKDYWHVQLPTGEVIGVRVGLCREHHRQVEEHEAQIHWKLGVYFWLDKTTDDFTGFAPLSWQPPRLDTPTGHRPGELGGSVEPNALTGEEHGTSSGEPPAVVADGNSLVAPFQEHSSAALGSASPVSAGESCPTCNRRIPHPRKDTSPVSKTISFRLPADEKESLAELIENTKTGLGFDEEKYPTARLVEIGLVLCLHHQEEVEEWLKSRQ